MPGVDTKDFDAEFKERVNFHRGNRMEEDDRKQFLINNFSPGTSC
jgi:hypothetical protein